MSARDDLIVVLVRIARGNRQIVADAPKLSRTELAAAIEAVADMAEAAVEAAKGKA